MTEPSKQAIEPSDEVIAEALAMTFGSEARIPSPVTGDTMSKLTTRERGEIKRLWSDPRVSHS